MDYILSNIQGLKQFKKIKKIKTNIGYLDQLGNKVIFDRFIKDKYNIDLEYTSDVDLPDNIKLDYVKSTGIEELIHNTYKKLITDKSIQELENDILIPPIFIDDFIQDTNKIISFNNYWNVLSLPDQQRNILANVVEEIEKLGDAAKISFDFDNALELYNKIYLTTLNCNNVDEIKANSLIKQADIYYHLDNFDLSKELFTDSLHISTKYDLHQGSAKAYYYLGMISYSLVRTKEADKYFEKSLNEYKINSDNVSFEYYKTKVRKYINSSQYEKSIISINSFIKAAIKNNDKYHIANGLGLKGNIYYWKKEYHKAEELYLKQKKISTANNDFKNIALSISHLISLYTFSIEKDYSIIDSLMTQLKEISCLIKKESYISEAYYRVGIYYFNLNKLNNSERYLQKSILYHKKSQYNYIYYSNLLYLGQTYFLLKKYLKAISTFNEIIKLPQSDNYNNRNTYLIYSFNTLGKIYMDKKEYELAVDNFDLSIELSIIQNNYIIPADSNKHLGLLYKKLNEPHLAYHYFSESLKFYNICIKNNLNMDLSKDLEFIRKELLLID